MDRTGRTESKAPRSKVKGNKSKRAKEKANIVNPKQLWPLTGIKGSKYKGSSTEAEDSKVQRAHAKGAEPKQVMLLMDGMRSGRTGFRTKSGESVRTGDRTNDGRPRVTGSKANMENSKNTLESTGMAESDHTYPWTEVRKPDCK